MTPQIEGAIAEQLGVPARKMVPSMAIAPVSADGQRHGDRNWDYVIVADRRTETEAQRYDHALPVAAENRAPSYQIMIRDNRRQTPQWEVLRADSGQAFRFSFDPSADQERARQAFEERHQTGVAPPNPIRPDIGDIIGAAFRQDNTVVSLAARLFSEQYPPDPDHNPLDQIRAIDSVRGTQYEGRHQRTDKAQAISGAQEPRPPRALRNPRLSRLRGRANR